MKTKTTQYQPKTGQPCHCRPGQERDNCPQCEGTGQRIDFAAIRARSTKTTHTPGPWRPYIGPGGPLQVIANHCNICNVDDCETQSFEEGSANARLIAAAPELLAALEGLLTAPDLNEDALDGETCELMAAARAALAKAKGGV